VQLTALTQSQRDRLTFIELRLRFIGEFQRQDLVQRFGIQAAAATRDVSQYKELSPRNLEYDTKRKVYVRATWFNPVFDFAASRILTWLSQGFGDGEPICSRRLVACEGFESTSGLDLEMLSILTRAIYKKTAVEISYGALSSGLVTREIVPFALADNGQRWHVRAFDRRKGDFRDFVLNRIADARLVDGATKEHESIDKDNQWNRIVEIELVPHPANIQHPDSIEAEYGMKSGVLQLRIRAAMAGYLMRRWNVDCTDDHSLKGAEHHLWLRNRQALYGVTNLLLAPGYYSPDREQG
jgi:predicted DNA-binding transcriptional regulator YafY